MLHQRPVASDSSPAFWYNMFHDPIVMFPAQTWIQPFFPRSPSSFYWEPIIRGNNLDVLGMLTATRLIPVSGPIQWAKLEVFVCIQ